MRDTEFAVAQDACAQSTAALQKLVRAGAERLVHPITWPAFFRALELHTLDFELRPNQIVQVDLARDHIPPRRRGRNASQIERITQRLKDVEGKKSDLSFVLIFVIEIAVAHDSMSGDAFDPRHFDDRMLARGPFVVPEIIVTRRNVKMRDLHGSTLSPAELPGEPFERFYLSCDHSV